MKNIILLVVILLASCNSFNRLNYHNVQYKILNFEKTRYNQEFEKIFKQYKFPKLYKKKEQLISNYLHLLHTIKTSKSITPDLISEITEFYDSLNTLNIIDRAFKINNFSELKKILIPNAKLLETNRYAINILCLQAINKQLRAYYYKAKWLINKKTNADLVAYYPFDSNGSDESENNNFADFYGGCSIVNNKLLNSCIYLDGKNDFINCGNIQIFNKSYSVSLLLQLAKHDNSDVKRIIGKGIAPDRRISSWSLNIEKDKSISFFWENNKDTDHLIISDLKIEENKTYHIVITQNTESGEFKIFINNKLEAKQKAETLPCITKDNLMIGTKITHFGKIRFINAYIDEVRIYKKALTKQEINLLYTSYSSVFK